jgi:hypothetical protein
VSSAAPLARPIDEAAAVARGWYDTVTPDNPAAGAEATYTVDARFFERIVAVTFRFVASAAVANRMPRVRYEAPDGRLLGAGTAGGNHTAGLTVDYALAPAMLAAGAIANGLLTGPLPDLELVPGSVVRITANNLDAADQISAVVIAVQRFSTEARSLEREPERRRRRGR